jgi:nuclear protein localization family protein 4
MLIRVRCNVGVWRIDGLSADTSTVQSILDQIAVQRPHVVYEQPLSSDAACSQPLDPGKTLTELNLQHGSMVYCRVDAATTVDISLPEVEDTAMTDASSSSSGAVNPSSVTNLNMRRIVDKDGCIKLVPSTEIRDPGQDRGFRRGMMPLRDMKMQWTLNDFMAMDAQFEFKVQRQEQAYCQQVSLDVPSISNFQAYLQRFQFQRKRYAFLYGTFVKGKNEDGEEEEKPTKVKVEAIYEPPQEVDSSAAEGFQVLDDPDEDVVNEIAALLGLTRVGWIFGHETRDKGYALSSAEIIMAAEFQLEAAGGVEETPFCTCAVSQGPDGQVSVEAFQVSKQCMAMVAEEALEVGDSADSDPKFTKINETFTAIQEGKASPTVENNFFLTVVPIVQHTSETFVADFPRANRDLDDRVPSHDEMKKHLANAGKSGWTFEDRLADFSLLVYLSKFLDVKADFPKICASVKDRSVPLDDGYKLIIKSMAGMDGSY